MIPYSYLLTERCNYRDLAERYDSQSSLPSIHFISETARQLILRDRTNCVSVHVVLTCHCIQIKRFIAQKMLDRHLITFFQLLLQTFQNVSKYNEQIFSLWSVMSVLSISFVSAINEHRVDAETYSSKPSHLDTTVFVLQIGAQL